MAGKAREVAERARAHGDIEAIIGSAGRQQDLHDAPFIGDHLRPREADHLCRQALPYQASLNGGPERRPRSVVADDGILCIRALARPGRQRPGGIAADVQRLDGHCPPPVALFG